LVQEELFNHLRSFEQRDATAETEGKSIVNAIDDAILDKQ
jgi:hypothetical protein